MIQKTSKDVWDILNEAIEAGWEDPGFTEPLETTRQRALEYLRQFKPVVNEPKPNEQNITATTKNY